MTEGQDKAFAFLNNHYGDAKAGEPGKDGQVKVTGVDEGGEDRCRWMVRDDGSISGAWDPDHILEIYLDERRAAV